MARGEFVAGRWAEAVLAAAGSPEAGAEAADLLEAVAAAFAAGAAGARTPRGTADAAALEAALERSFAAAGRTGRAAEAARRAAAALARRGKTDRLEDVSRALRAACDKARGIVRARADFAFPPTAEELAATRSAVLRRTGAAAAELEVGVDARLLGGIRLEIGWKRLDATLGSRLEALASAGGASWKN